MIHSAHAQEEIGRQEEQAEGRSPKKERAPEETCSAQEVRAGQEAARKQIRTNPPGCGPGSRTGVCAAGS